LNKINLEGRNRSNVNGQGAKHTQPLPLSRKERKKEKDKKSRYTKKQIFNFAKKITIPKNIQNPLNLYKATAWKDETISNIHFAVYCGALPHITILFYMTPLKSFLSWLVSTVK
jgi:hypothetical protein